MQLTVEVLEKWLQEAEAAHHAYEEASLDGKRDEEWIAWYADFLMKKIEETVHEE